MANPSAVAPLLQLGVFVVGAALAASPFLVEGGVIGWWKGMQVRPETDVLGVQTFAKHILNFASIALGLLLCNLAGFSAIAWGLFRAAQEKDPAPRTEKKDPPLPPDPSIGEGI